MTWAKLNQLPLPHRPLEAMIDSIPDEHKFELHLGDLPNKI
jgi:hypothetical protein